jgi:DNA-binding beta-propeller fold protein YncE/plastocyanin
MAPAARAQESWVAVAADGYTGKVLFFTVPGLKLVKAVRVGTDIADVVVTADGKFAFAADKADNRIVKLDLSSFSTAAIELPLNTGPSALALSPDGKYLFVAGGLDGSVTRIDLAANQVQVASLQITPASATSVGVSADGKNCFVTDMINDHLAVFSTDPFSLTKKLTLGYAPQSLAQGAGNVCAVTNRLNCVMSFVDAVALKNTDNIETAALPLFVTPSPDGKFAYECAQLGNVVSQVDIAKREVVNQFSADSRPHAAGVTPDGKFLVVSNGYAPDAIRQAFSAKSGPAVIPPTALQVIELPSGKSRAVVPVPGDIQGGIRLVSAQKLGAWTSEIGEDLLPQAQAATLDIARDEKIPLEFGEAVGTAPRVDLAGDPVVVYLKAFSYMFVPATIQVYTGAHVRILITNADDRAAFTRDEDVVHGFCINGYGTQTNVIVPKGKTAAFTFTADKAGTFQFYCSRSCGPMHSLMRGKLIVQ